MGDTSHSLEKNIKFRQLFAIGFGTIIGVGWIVVSGSWITTAGPVGALAAFFVGGVAISFIGLCYGELGSMFPHSGGEIVYIYEAMGTRLAFVAGWFLALIYITISAYLAITIGWVVTEIFSGFSSAVAYSILGHDITWLELTLALGGFCLLTFVNIRGGGSMARFQEFFTLIFTLSFVITIGAGMVAGSPGNIFPLFAGSTPKEHFYGFLAVLAIVPVWYGGFNCMPQALGELDSEQGLKAFPQILSITIFLVFLFYSFVIIGAALAAPREIIESTDIPSVDVLFYLFESRLAGTALLLTGLIGIITSWNGVFYAGTRVLFCLGRARLLPGGFAAVNARGAPYISVVLILGCSLLFSLGGRELIYPALNLISLCYAMIYVFVCLSLARLRRRQTYRPGSFSVPCLSWFVYIATFIAIVFSILALTNIVRSSAFVVPLELLIFFSWLVLALLVMWAGKSSRHSISENERSELIHMR